MPVQAWISEPNADASMPALRKEITEH
jgi:hypothetical protein